MHPDDKRSEDDNAMQKAKTPPAAGDGAGAADAGQRGAVPGGHYENTDHGYGTGIKAKAGDAPADDPAYGGRPGQYDAGQRHNDRPDPAVPATGSTPASDEERHGVQHGSESASEGYQSSPAGGEGVFGTNAPFGGGPEPDKDAAPGADPAPKK